MQNMGVSTLARFSTQRKSEKLWSKIDVINIIKLSIIDINQFNALIETVGGGTIYNIISTINIICLRNKKQTTALPFWHHLLLMT